MLVYATPDDLLTWLPSGTAVPDDAVSLLRSASILVARAVNESLYDDGTIVTAPKTDATCAQVAAWGTTGIQPGSGGLSGTATVKTKAVGDARLEYDTTLSSSAAALVARADIAGALCPEAEAILYAAGLLYSPLPLFTALPAWEACREDIGLNGARHNQSLWPYETEFWF